MQAVILAGGLGTRLRPFTEIIPKPLLPLGERSLMEIQISRLKDCGFDEIFVATNYRSDFIEAFLGDGSKFGVKLHYSQEQKPLGTCGPLTLIKKHLTGPFLMMNGDILTKLNFGEMLDFSVKQESLLTVGTKIITLPFRFGNVVVDDKDRILSVEEKPDLKFEILAGIYCLTPGIFAHIPDDEYFGMDQLIKKMLNDGNKISRYMIKDYWLDIGQVEDYNKARSEVEQNF
jgi:NDP-mannose synthase